MREKWSVVLKLWQKKEFNSKLHEVFNTGEKRFYMSHLPFQLPVVVDESTELRREFHLGNEILCRGIVVEGLLQLDQLRRSVRVVLEGRGGGAVSVLGGGLPYGSVLGAI